MSFSGGNFSCSRHELPPVRPAGGIDLSLPAALPVLLEPVRYPPGDELATPEWQRVLREAAALGVMHVGFSGGEPLLRRDLAELVAGARAAGLLHQPHHQRRGTRRNRAGELREAGLDSVQISFQADEAARGGHHRRGAGA